MREGKIAFAFAVAQHLVLILQVTIGDRVVVHERLIGAYGAST